MKKDTLLTGAGRNPKENFGIVNPPVYRASTVLSETLADLAEKDRTPFDGVRYGRRGTPTHLAFEEAMAAFEGGYRSIAAPSGLNTVASSLLAFLGSGDHLLMTDAAYAPSRIFCERMLKGLGIETTFYDPVIGAGIAELIRPNTKVVFTESPGSLTFEVQDLPAIASAAHAAGAVVVMDNTWATPYFFRPLDFGADVSLNACTKYVVGHSDAMLGSITAKDEATWLRCRRATAMLGVAVGPDDVYLGLRGLRTLGVRLERHQETALTLARWLAERPEVEAVLHPALPDTPGHELWKRDFTGSSGLFSVVLRPGYSDAAIAAFVDGLVLFGIGYSWGGFESLIVPANPQGIRTASAWPYEGYSLRIHAGLEDPEDLIADLDAGLGRLADTA